MKSSHRYVTFLLLDYSQPNLGLSSSSPVAIAKDSSSEISGNTKNMTPKASQDLSMGGTITNIDLQGSSSQGHSDKRIERRHSISSKTKVKLLLVLFVPENVKIKTLPK